MVLFALVRLLICYINPERLAGWKLVVHLVATQPFGLFLLTHRLPGLSAAGRVPARPVPAGPPRPRVQRAPVRRRAPHCPRLCASEP